MLLDSGPGLTQRVAIERKNRHNFQDRNVAVAYRHRPPYDPKVWDLLVEIAPIANRALDIGCGPGKIAHQLAKRFKHVDAVDPSIEMLKIGGRQTAMNIHWIHADAETALLNPPYNLATAGASLHWMKLDVVFPRLNAVLHEGAPLAVIDGDGANNPPWEGEWVAFLKRWLAKVGRKYDSKAFASDQNAFEAWLDVQGREVFERSFSQSVDAFIEAQHSRATWARHELGDLVEPFDEELRALLSGHADGGHLVYRVKTRVTWGLPRETPLRTKLPRLSKRT